jgi:hypothetical protein
LLACFLYIVKSLKPDVLLSWFHSKGIDPTFLDLLALCVKQFEYVGRDKIAEQAASVPATAKKLKFVSNRLMFFMRPLLTRHA